MEVQYFKLKIWDDKGKVKLDIVLSEDLSKKEVNQLHKYLEYFKKATNNKYEKL